MSKAANRTQTPAWWGHLIGVIFCVAIAAASVEAATIQLKDRTKLKGDVVRVADEDVFIRLPRHTIATVDGKSLPAALVTGGQAPPFTATDLLGQSHQIGAGSGKVTVLHFWVSWCPHCRSDAPKIQALYDQFHDNTKVQIITVNLEDERAKIDAFVTAHHVTYPVIAAEEQGTESHSVNLPQLYQITGFPVTFIIDAQGVIRQKTTGSFVETRVDLASQVAALIASSQATPASSPKSSGSKELVPSP